MNLSFLDEYGWCCDCEQWIKMEPKKSELPNHDNGDDKKCPNSGYSAWETKYEINSIEKAKKIATIIVEDNNVCLYGGNMHSMACGDGESCSVIRKLLSSALANFVLKKY